MTVLVPESLFGTARRRYHVHPFILHPLTDRERENKMTKRTYLTGIGAVCAAIIVSAGLLAQDKENPYGEMSPEQEAMMKAWMEYATPGMEHAELAKKVGEWSLDLKMWHELGGEVEISKATSTIKPIMDGHYFLETVKSEYMGMPFEGRALFGFDNLTKKYFTIWIDNMSTGLMTYTGTASGEGTIHYSVEMPNIETGKYETSSATDKMVSDNKYIFVMNHKAPSGEEFKAMEITATRKGTAKSGPTTSKKGY